MSSGGKINKNEQKRDYLRERQDILGREMEPPWGNAGSLNGSGQDYFKASNSQSHRPPVQPRKPAWPVEHQYGLASPRNSKIDPNLKSTSSESRIGSFGLPNQLKSLSSVGNIFGGI
ncbi:hypothetical protein PT974_03214 [Cladobotryum mycophilum]|uniref:Uncharacterized protein n=1 Tax=Cladobotryum mycophilum TaxID=491253 RepID=A0ABR0SRN5_9HYPO